MIKSLIFVFKLRHVVKNRTPLRPWKHNPKIAFTLCTNANELKYVVILEIAKHERFPAQILIGEHQCVSYADTKI